MLVIGQQKCEPYIQNQMYAFTFISLGSQYGYILQYVSFPLSIYLGGECSFDWENTSYDMV